MGIKDWKKIGENKWHKNGVIIGVIYSPLTLGKNKYILIEKDKEGIQRIRRMPATKSQALKYAKVYMIKH